MPKIILVPVGGTAADTEALSVALALGRPRDAHIVALHVRPDVRRDIAGLAAADGGMAAGIDGVIARMEAEADTREKSATEHWTLFCSQNGIAVADAPRPTGLTSEWVSEIGTEADWLAEYGRTADMIVVPRGGEEWGPDLVLMEAALMDTGKPVVIAPSSKATAGVVQPNGVIGIAWKDTREAASAVRAAMPFIEAATHVTIFIVPEDEGDQDKSHLRLAKMLRWHNPHVSIQALREHSRPPVTVLLDAATQAGCGLLVMGGYGHTRLREAVFGGFTRAVLEAAPLPVLMTH
jgi:nucleotide-binding universal stress UspA family protein